MERRSFSAYNSSSGDHYAGDELWSSPIQIASFPAEIPAQGSFRQKEEKSIYLSPVIKIFSRFRLRVIFQNMSNYLVLFIGIIFANLLLMFGLLLPSALSHYQVEIQNNMLAKYQYMLQVPVSAVGGNKFDGLISQLEFYMDSRTDNEDAEEFSAYSLNTLPGKYKSEEVLLYGIEPDSRYVTIDFNNTKDKKMKQGIKKKQITRIRQMQKKKAQQFIFRAHMRINSCFMWGIPSL